MPQGLLPQDVTALKQEILSPAFGYDAATNIGCAYEHTGQLAGPSPAPAGLRGPAGQVMIVHRSQSLLRISCAVLAGEKPWPPPPTQTDGSP